MTDTAQQRYLRIVQSALADVPHDRRTMVLEDVQAHIQDAVDHGASVEDALTQLGPAKALAFRAREEMSSALPSLAAGVR
ncbi:HAAS signaling domain-containing protein, partial [Enterococcus faecium]